MQNFPEIVKQAHDAATAAMAAALDGYQAWLNQPGNEGALATAKRICGNAVLEPTYCGFAWVIVRRKANPDFIKAMKSAAAFGSGGSRHDLGSPTGWANKGQRTTATDWSFHGPGEYRGQSMDIKEVGAKAFAKVLSDAGLIDVSVYTRGD